MTAEELLAQYPSARHAVSFCELIVEDDSFRLFIQHQIPPDECIGILRETLEDCIRDGDVGKWQEAIDELTTDDFRRYLAGKLGIV